ncbi:MULTISPECIES: hypothetical protein [unclassified Tolypothrix]|uniref:hypothetical protein n=1 Tax=unclassified Tolypothrix TaxID=2649714 RepID=UPI0005EAA8C6|nr:MULTISPECIES: hypothetical protein [unclassified Tolypothrix]BAY92565.1 hypothetical protein NIES3275_46010 [Microchaete diplosiphon NIES-3275]EKF05638.1 hypothetical protein FDUTEX481_00493 [Tolypothrix sp. PCC 7601]MBE9086653.1 hypothetical protein [Tolypothrix sp. LEGE 11397]UYD26520.1 hypothetical protein HGR01_35455 [Tolypothrix sp. PCC 7712]UYD31243.1 hypothetical protein HG267_19025 [Tolypothrix sp. PCC 7601]
MKSYTESLPRVISFHLRVTSIAILLISGYLVIFKNIDTTTALNSLNANHFSTNSTESLTSTKANSQETKDIYIPPNYGGPDSEHGSGTR